MGAPVPSLGVMSGDASPPLPGEWGDRGAGLSHPSPPPSLDCLTTLKLSSPQSPKALHALRLRIKRCRYALEALSSTRERGTAGKVMRYLLVLQSRLGEHRDIVLAREWVSQRGPDIGQATVRVLTERLGVREAQARLALGLVPA